MKVITQLIRHFWQRGALTSVEVDYLVLHGFVRAGDLPGYRPGRISSAMSVEPREVPDIGPPCELELQEEHLVRRGPSRGKGADRQDGKGNVLTIQDLKKRLQKEFQRRSVDMNSLLTLGRRFSDCDDWRDAAAQLRQVPPDDFYSGLRSDLDSQRIMLGDLWQAADPEPFHGLVLDDEIRGRAARAYAALLVSPDAGALGKYTWILRHAEIKTMINLRVVHAHLLESFRRLYERDRVLLMHSMARNCDDVQFWSLVILYNAGRQPPQGETPDYGHDYGPLDLPDFPVWKQAWTAAMMMNRPPVTRLLADCYGEEATQKSAPTNWECRRAIMCPVGWHVPEKD